MVVTVLARYPRVPPKAGELPAPAAAPRKTPFWQQSTTISDKIKRIWLGKPRALTYQYAPVCVPEILAQV